MTTTYEIPVLTLRMVAEQVIRVPQKACIGPEATRDLAFAEIGDAPQEHLIAICLDARMNVTGICRLAIGSMHAAAIAPADVLRAVLAHHCDAFVLAHNHPSGDPRPSPQDRKLTASVRAAARVIGVPLLDHVIVTRDPHLFSSHGGEES